MPYPIDPDYAWPYLCKEGRQLRLQCELAQNLVDQSRGRRKDEAAQAKQGKEDDLQAHLDTCPRCTDRPTQSSSRLRFHTRSPRRVRPSRPSPANVEDLQSARRIESTAPSTSGQLNSPTLDGPSRTASGRLAG